jgi:hypothetical protein
MKHPIQAEKLWARRLKKSSSNIHVQNCLEFLAAQILDPNSTALQQQRLSAVAHLLMGFDANHPDFILFALLDELKLTSNWLTAEPGTQIVLAWQLLEYPQSVQFQELLKPFAQDEETCAIVKPLNTMLNVLEEKRAYSQSVTAIIEIFEKESTLPVRALNNSTGLYAYAEYIGSYFKSTTADKNDPDPLQPIKEWKINFLAQWDQFLDENDFRETPLENIKKIFSDFVLKQLNVLKVDHNDAYLYFEKIFEPFIIKPIVIDVEPILIDDNQNTGKIKIENRM